MSSLISSEGLHAMQSNLSMNSQTPRNRIYHVTTVNSFFVCCEMVQCLLAVTTRVSAGLIYLDNHSTKKVLKSASLSREQRGKFVKTFKFCDFEVFSFLKLYLKVKVVFSEWASSVQCVTVRTEWRGVERESFHGGS